MLPITCPSCEHELIAKKMLCEECGTEVDGAYPLPLLTGLSVAQQDFIIQFIKASGSLKEMAKLRKLSYPTVRNQLNIIIESIVDKEE